MGGNEEMNNVMLIGRLCKDPDLTHTSNTNTPICKFTLAVDRGKDKEGNDKGADFPFIKVIGKQAESCAKYLEKGLKVAVDGRLTTGSYKNQEGETVYTTEVTARHVEFLEWKAKDGERPEPSYDREESAEERWNRKHLQNAPAAPSQYERPPLPTEPPPPHQFGIVMEVDDDLPF
jgi:single-strand DNA-binding protein